MPLYVRRDVSRLLGSLHARARPFSPIKFRNDESLRTGEGRRDGVAAKKTSNIRYTRARGAGMFVLYVACEGYNNNIGTNARVGYIVVTTDHVESRDPPRRPGTARSRL